MDNKKRKRILFVIKKEKVQDIIRKEKVKDTRFKKQESDNLLYLFCSSIFFLNCCDKDLP